MIGKNLLKKALSVIPAQTVGYHRYLGRTTNAIGKDIATYAPVQTVRGSFQYTPRQLYERYGLDLNSVYATFYAPLDLMDVQRDVSGDQLSFDGKRWQCLSAPSDWFTMDGWRGIMVVQIGLSNEG